MAFLIFLVAAGGLGIAIAADNKSNSKETKGCPKLNGTMEQRSQWIIEQNSRNIKKINQKYGNRWW